MKDEAWATFGLIVAVACMILLGLFLASIKFTPAYARDIGQWENTDPAIREWYKSLIQPDNAPVSCCGEADSYYCDEHARASQIYCVVNDERDNEALHRKPVPNGTEINIPNNKLNRDPNPIGRAIVFLAPGGFVYCFVGAGGV